MLTKCSLPPEIFDYIVDFLYDHTPALKSCSLVSRGWVPTCQLHLFRCISLSHHKANETPCKRLNDVLDHSPDLALFIVELSIYETNPRIGWPWITRERSLPLLLQKLKRLRRLDIVVLPNVAQVMSLNWTPELTAALGAAIAHSPIETLYLRHVIFTEPLDLMRLLMFIPHLKALFLDHPEFSDTVQNNSITPSAIFRNQESLFGAVVGTVKPRVLQLMGERADVIAGCLLHSLSPLDMSNIQRLTIQIAGDFSIYAELLGLMPSLKFLEIWVLSSVNYDVHWTRSIDLSRHPLLTELILDFKVMLDRHDPLPWIHSLFSSVHPDNLMKEISLVATVDMPPPYLTLPVYQRSLDGWRRLDALLTEPIFNPLERLRVDFGLDNTIDDQIVPHIVQDFISQLRALDRKGVLEIDACEIR